MACESRPHCWVAINTAVCPSTYTHSQTRIQKTNNSTHKKKKHTYALNTGRPNCHWSAVCAHSLWHEYSKNILILPIMHVYTVCECTHRLTKMSFVLKLRNHVEYRGLVGRPYNTLNCNLLLIWDLPLSLHHQRGQCGLACWVTSRPKDKSS